jgi:predicted TIM-barrel fold metal-dependent hydrolase
MRMPSDHYTVISADCHAGPPRAQLRHHFDPQHRDAFDEFCASSAPVAASADEAFEAALQEVGVDREVAASHAARAARALQALSDSEVRLSSLADEGIVAEVVFPDASLDNAPPFQGPVEGTGHLIKRGRERYPFELQLAGARAHNRWLAEFCAEAPGRRAGVAVVPRLEEVDAVVDLLVEAHGLGLSGGFVLPLVGHGLPGYNHERYERLWSTAADLGMPVNCHAETGGPDDPHVYGAGLDSYALEVTEIPFFARRPLWFLLWGGVLERHPDLRVAFTEQMADWVPAQLRELEQTYDMVFLGELRKTLHTRPRECWARQCSIGATFMSPLEAELRHEIGVDTIMWGSDFPHPEGTWPYTHESLQRTFGDIPEHETRAMLGENAARVYGFDLDALQPIAAAVGPAPDDLKGWDGLVPADNVGMGFR